MKVELLYHTPLFVAANAIRHCWGTEDKADSYPSCQNCGADVTDVEEEDGRKFCPDCGLEFTYQTRDVTCGEKDLAIIDRVANKHKHESTIEHLSYSFDICGVSRALLLELSRHRISSFSVKSSRYTLKELKGLKFVEDNDDKNHFSCDKLVTIENPSGYCDSTCKVPVTDFIVLTGKYVVDSMSIDALGNLAHLVSKGISNDLTKYAMPECFKTRLTWSINARSLKNFLNLRSNKSALWEIRELAYAIYETIPQNHKFLFKESMYENQ